MKITAFLLFLGLLPVLLSAQTDSLPRPAPQQPLPIRISAARQELRAAFIADDPAAAGLWMDSLDRLENNTYLGLVWDERWLLYFWEDAYGNMFDEVIRFDADQEKRAYKIQPRSDSLFETLDRTLYEQRYTLFNRLQSGFLNEEERAFAALQLDYLLRLNTDEKDWAARLDAFLRRFPDSRFASYIRSIRPEMAPSSHRGFGFSVALLSGDWTGQLDRSINPLYTAEVEVYIWRKGWQYCLKSIAGASPTLGRQIDVNGYNWLKDDRTYFRNVGLEVGRDVIDGKRFRITPSTGIYLSTLSPAPPDTGENPDYYSEFYFNDIHFTAALTADLKLFKGDWNLVGLGKETFHGLRLRAGYHWMRLGRQNPAFAGNLFYFALGYQLFLHKPSN